MFVKMCICKVHVPMGKLVAMAFLTWLSIVIGAEASGKQSLSFPFAVTNLAVEEVDSKGLFKRRSRVRFHTLTKGSKTFAVHTLANVVETGRTEKGHPIFEATTVGHHTFQALIDAESPDLLDRFLPFRHRKTLLCVHGANTSPENWFRECAKFVSEHRYGGNYTVIPVIWPAGDKIIQRYMDDGELVSPEAAEAFLPLLEVARSLQGCSILCHSMGNYVLRIFSLPRGSRNRKPTFDRIFMAAADLRDDTFNSFNNKNPDARYNIGKNIAALAREQVHVLYSRSDLSLAVGRRVRLRWGAALGNRGVHPQKLHKDLRNKVVCLDCNPFNKWSWSNMFWHSYHFKSEAIKYYEQKQYPTYDDLYS